MKPPVGHTNTTNSGNQHDLDHARVEKPRSMLGRCSPRRNLRLVWLVVIDAQTLESRPESHSLNSSVPTIRRWRPGSCVWCGDDNSVDMFRNEPRCGKCRENEGIIDDAKRFLGMYGLRPLGGTLQSDDDEEREYRVNAREARRVLNEIRMDVLPDAAAVRKAIRPRAATVVADTSPARASRPASTGTATRVAAPVKTDTVDIDTLQTRVLGLLDQLGSIDEQIKVAELAQGLPARARLSDLNKQKATVLRTLAALEKARIAASN